MGKARPLAHLERNERIEAETARIVELYRELDDADRVAEALNLTTGRVRRRLQYAGVSTRILRVERAAEVFKATGSIEETARFLGLTLATARSRLEGAVALKLIDELPERTTRRGGALRPRSGSVQPGRAPQRLHPEVEAATVALYEQLHSLRKVATKLGISHEAVRLRLINAGCIVDPNPRMSREDDVRAAVLYRRMQSVTAVAAEMGRSPLTVRNALSRQGVDVNGQGQWHDDLREPRLYRDIGEARLMSRLYERLGTEVAVAALLGCSQALVSKRLKLIDAAPGRGNHVRGPRAPRPCHRETARRVAELYESGLSARQATIAAGVTPHTALRWLRQAGYDTSKAARAARLQAA
jgi:predicted transcriptional regulator